MHANAVRSPGTGQPSRLTPRREAAAVAYEFAGFRFDALRGLDFDARRIHLTPKESAALETLLRAGGRLVTKDELVRGVWDTATASDASITRVMYRIRVALGHVSREEIVETVYGAGYRMAVPVVARVVGDRNSAAATATAVAESVVTARELMGRRSPADLVGAIGVLEQALALDSTYVPAWTLLAEVERFRVERGLVPPRDGAAQILAATDRALALDPTSTAAHAIRGWSRAFVDHAWDEGLAELDQAIALGPTWLAHALRAEVRSARGRHADALADYEAVDRLHPASILALARRGLTLCFAGRTREALERLRAAAAQFPTIDGVQGSHSIVASVAGFHDEAIAAGRRAAAHATAPIMLTALASALARAGQAHHAEARALVASLEAAPVGPPPSLMASVYLALGERDRAIAELRRARRDGCVWLASVADDPRLAPLRADPAVSSLWEGWR